MFYVVQFPDGSHQHSSVPYFTSADAEAWQAVVEARLSKSGTLFTSPSWELTPEGSAFKLKEAQDNKIAELIDEANSRLPEGIDNIATLQSILKSTQTITPEAEYGRDVFDAGKNARQVILSLPTAADVNAYDVVTDPAWPPPFP